MFGDITYILTYLFGKVIGKFWYWNLAVLITKMVGDSKKVFYWMAELFRHWLRTNWFLWRRLFFTDRQLCQNYYFPQAQPQTLTSPPPPFIPINICTNPNIIPVDDPINSYRWSVLKLVIKMVSKNCGQDRPIIIW